MSVTLRIRAVDESGAPVAGAVVHARDTVVATTDVDGIAMVHDIETGFANLTVSHSMPAEVQLVLTFGAGSSGVFDRTVTLRRGAALRGTVVSPDGAPLSGGIIELWLEPDGVTFAESAFDGMWCFAAVHAGAYEVRAGADGYARSPAVAGTHDGRTERAGIVLRVERGSRLWGRVHERDGTPVGGADVRAEMDLGDSAKTTTAADGRFELFGLGEGRHRVSVTQRSWRTTVVMPGDGGDLELDIEVPGLVLDRPANHDADEASVPTSTLTGRVVRDGAPVSRFAIVRKGLAAYRWITDPALIHAPDGRFTLGDLSESSCTVHVLALGTAWTSTHTLELTPGSTLDLGDLELHPGLRITGRVSTSNGEPISCADVIIGRPHRDDPLHDAAEGSFATTSGPDGSFVFGGIHLRDRHTRIHARHPAHGASLHALLAGVEESFELVLVPTGSIEGHLEPNGALNSALIIRAANAENGGGVVRIRPSGLFLVEQLVPGDYVVELVERQGPPRRAVHAVVVAGQCTRVQIPPP